MAWPKGQKRPNAFKPKGEVTKEIEPDLPVNEKLSNVIAGVKAVLQSYRCDIETKIIENGNVTSSIELKVTFYVR